MRLDTKFNQAQWNKIFTFLKVAPLNTDDLIFSHL